MLLDNSESSSLAFSYHWSEISFSLSASCNSKFSLHPIFNVATEVLLLLPRVLVLSLLLCGHNR